MGTGRIDYINSWPLLCTFGFLYQSFIYGSLHLVSGLRMQVQMRIRKCGFESILKTLFFVFFVFLTLKSAWLLLHSEKLLNAAPGPRDMEM